VHLVGCPRIDLVADVLKNDSGPMQDDLFAGGVGADFDLERPFVLVSQHPVTTEYGEGESQITASAAGGARCRSSGHRAVAECGRRLRGRRPRHSQMARARSRRQDAFLPQFAGRDLYPPDAPRRVPGRQFVERHPEGAYIGTPVVNIGSRQAGRERGRNVIDCAPDPRAIAAAVKRQIGNGRHEMDPIYGDGHAGRRIADVLAA
jgi:hypothetical protein